MLKGTVPLATISSFADGKRGPNPRLANGISPKSGYLPLYGVGWEALRFGKMPRGVFARREKLGALDFLASQIKARLCHSRFSASDIARIGGPSAEIDVGERTSNGCDMGRGLLEGRVEVRAKTDFLRCIAPKRRNTRLIYTISSRGICRGLRKLGLRTSSQRLVPNDRQMYHRHVRNSNQGGSGGSLLGRPIDHVGKGLQLVSPMVTRSPKRRRLAYRLYRRTSLQPRRGNR